LNSEFGIRNSEFGIPAHPSQKRGKGEKEKRGKGDERGGCSLCSFSPLPLFVENVLTLNVLTF
jgi:hypothetical protein